MDFKKRSVGAWDAFSDLAVMQAFVELGKRACDAIDYSNNAYLIGTSAAETPPNVPVQKAAHPAVLAPVPDEPEDIVSIFDIVDCTDKYEMQYATFIFLAIDEEHRELIAQRSPPVAAEFVRSFPSVVQAVMLGTENTPAKTPHETAIYISLRIELAYAQ